jgi:pyridoxamine 5'-phosphate oxidase
MSIASIRRDYMLESLTESDAASNPFRQFDRWWDEAVRAEIDEVNAMTLSTVSISGRPSSRIVLLKGYDDGGFVFFTNYLSRKGREIAGNAYVSLLFFWKELERQVRVDGLCTAVSEAESDSYFHSRPEGSRLGAWASPQSERISSREILDENLKSLEQTFAGTAIPRPPHWGGYRVVPSSFEFWQGRPSRLHDRIVYQTNAEGDWSVSRLAP